MHARMFGRARMLSLVLGSTLVLAACGGGGGDEANGDAATDAAGAPATTTTITMLDNEYTPSDPVVSGGGELELVNDGEAPHTFTVEGQDVDVEVEAGATATATIDLEPGTYTLFCEFHRSQGMETTLTVQ